MTGVKGQKWKKDRKPSRIKTSITLRPRVKEELHKMAIRQNVSFSECINRVIENFFADIIDENGEEI